MVLLRQLLSDDVADFLPNLFARHLVERLQVGEVEKPLVQLDLELGVLVALRKCAGVPDGYEPMLFERLLASLLDLDFTSCRLADLPHTNAPIRVPPRVRHQVCQSLSKAVSSA